MRRATIKYVYVPSPVLEKFKFLLSGRLRALRRFSAFANIMNNIKKVMQKNFQVNFQTAVKSFFVEVNLFKGDVIKSEILKKPPRFYRGGFWVIF